jgi:hypothetical protein
VIDVAGVFAIDGHDGAGKTTLARWLAINTGGMYVRTFYGTYGSTLLSAADNDDTALVLTIGEAAICNAISTAGAVRPIILDRAWMTVASLIDWHLFMPRWSMWIPTVLCWANLDTTTSRLGQRNEQPEAIDIHRKYLDVYRSLAIMSDNYVLRTDLNTVEQCQELLMAWFKNKIS